MHQSVYPLSVLLIVCLGLVSASRSGRRSIEFRICVLTFAYLVVCYVISFIVVCALPYWIDNGVEEFIPWSGRFSLALLSAAFVELLLCPVLATGIFILISRHSKKTRSGADRKLT